eukprot:m.9793 g.9793  ORF g.9793 m.9793 type:complete len:431 (-) comp4134_c0_seq1:1020-2312(-)
MASYNAGGRLTTGQVRQQQLAVPYRKQPQILETIQTVKDIFTDAFSLVSYSETFPNGDPLTNTIKEIQKVKEATGGVVKVPEALKAAKRALNVNLHLDSLLGYQRKLRKKNPLLFKDPETLTEPEVGVLLNLLRSADHDDDERVLAADQLRHLTRNARGRGVLQKTGKLHVVVDMLVDPDLVTKLSLVVLNMAFSDSNSSDLRNALIEVGAIEKLGIVLSYAKRAGKLAALCALRNIAAGCGLRKDFIVRNFQVIEAIVSCILEREDRVTATALRVLITLVVPEEATDSAAAVNERKNTLVYAQVPEAVMLVLKSKRLTEGYAEALEIVIKLMDSSIDRLRVFVLLGLPKVLPQLVPRIPEEDTETLDAIADIQYELVQCSGGEFELFSYPAVTKVFPSTIGNFANNYPTDTNLLNAAIHRSLAATSKKK